MIDTGRVGRDRLLEQTPRVSETLKGLGLKVPEGRTVYHDNRGGTHHRQGDALKRNLQLLLEYRLTPVRHRADDEDEPVVRSIPLPARADPQCLHTWLLENALELRPFILAWCELEKPRMHEVRE